MTDVLILHLMNMRNELSNDDLCQSAWDYIRKCEQWKRVMEKRINVHKNVVKRLKVYNGEVKYLLNAIVAVKSKDVWVGAVVGYVEDNSVLIFKQSSRKDHWTIIPEMDESIKEGHIRLF